MQKIVWLQIFCGVSKRMKGNYTGLLRERCGGISLYGGMSFKDLVDFNKAL